MSPASEWNAADQQLYRADDRKVHGMCRTRSGIRYMTVRGYKSEEGMMNGTGLTQWVWSGREEHGPIELIAAQTGVLPWSTLTLSNHHKALTPPMGRLPLQP